MTSPIANPHQETDLLLWYPASVVPGRKNHRYCEENYTETVEVLLIEGDGSYTVGYCIIQPDWDDPSVDDVSWKVSGPDGYIADPVGWSYLPNPGRTLKLFAPYSEE